MIVDTACKKCGYQAAATAAASAAYCIKCGERLAQSSSDDAQLTMAPSQPGSSAVRSAAHAASSIDGYEIISLLGRGGMGSVYRAYEPLLDREVALKVLSSTGDDDARSRAAARFLSEAVLTGRLGHSGIIPIHKVGHDSNVGFYYTMRYIRGSTLADIIASLNSGDERAREEFHLQRLLTIFLRVCQALGFAHQNKIIHRDIKPANLMVAEFGEVFVLDWGLAKDIATVSNNTPPDGTTQRVLECRKRRGTTTQLFLLKDRGTPTNGKSSVLRRLQSLKTDSTRLPATQADQVLGTPGFLSPEQGFGEANIGPASDVYALGVTLYELLTQRRPAEAPTPEGLILKTMSGDLIPIQRQPAAAKLPSALCDIVTRALALKPEDRFPNASAMAEEIALYLEGRATFKPLSRAVFGAATSAADWKVTAGNALPGSGALVLEAGAAMKCDRIANGDFQFECEAFAEGSRSWCLQIAVHEVMSGGKQAPRYVVRLGNDGRSFVELLREEKMVQRRLDARLQSGQQHKIRVDLEASKLRVWIDGRKCIDYHEIFPQAGGAVQLCAESGQLNLVRADLVSRGSPLHLSFMALPDEFYRRGKFAEARELYRRLSESHPDREEGILALFKAGLCSTAMQDLESAFSEFTRLEGSMCDHYCAIGLAQIGMIDGNIEWAWEALKNACRRNQDHSAQTEIWFTLTGLIQHLPAKEFEEKRRRYLELIIELNPPPEEAAHLTCEMLELVQQAGGSDGVRAEALGLLETFSTHQHVRREALNAVWRSGIDDASIAPVKNAVDDLLRVRPTADAGRLNLMRAEIHLALKQFDEAHSALRDAILESGASTPEGLWAKSWQILLGYLKGQHQQAITECHEVLARQRKTCAPSMIAYLHLLEALASFGKGSPTRASIAINEAMRSSCLWGKTAKHVLLNAAPARLDEVCAQASPVQLAEAHWIAGELHANAGRRDLAAAHFQHCLNSPSRRAFCSSLAHRSLATPPRTTS